MQHYVQVVSKQHREMNSTVTRVEMWESVSASVATCDWDCRGCSNSECVMVAKGKSIRLTNMYLQNTKWKTNEWNDQIVISWYSLHGFKSMAICMYTRSFGFSSRSIVFGSRPCECKHPTCVNFLHYMQAKIYCKFTQPHILTQEEWAKASCTF